MSKNDDRSIAFFVTGSSDPLTRSQVADYLGVSISTVRRMEGKTLHPTTDDRGVHRFDAEQVIRAAESLRADDADRPAKPVKLSPGELAAEVFERFEQRHSLSEIVRELRIEPRRVRRLYHEWRISLDNGEQRRRDPAPPWSSQVSLFAYKLEPRLAALPDGQPTRISLALGGLRAWCEEWKQEVDVYTEIGGLITHGPITPGELTKRFGEGNFRITAYSLTEKRILWEILAHL